MHARQNARAEALAAAVGQLVPAVERSSMSNMIIKRTDRGMEGCTGGRKDGSHEAMPQRACD